MPRRAKGPRLWLRPARRGADGRLRPAVWIIRDGPHQRSTGCGATDLRGAERCLAEFLAERHVAGAARRERGADAALVADVLAVYARDVAARQARPKEAVARLARLESLLGDRTLAEINGAACRDYAAQRGAPAAARRELEDLRAAVNHYAAEGLCRVVPRIPVPERAPARQRWLTRDEAAKLIRTAWRWRETQGGRPTGRASRKHVARFVLVALYTGSRAGAVCAAAFAPTPGRGFLDLDHGLFYRRPAGEAETRKRRPPVPIPPRLLAHLRRWRRLGAVAPVTYAGAPVARMAKAFRATARAAGLPDVTPHTLRHTAATWLMQAGTDLWAAAGFLGMTPETLSRIYGHHHPDYLRAARDAIAARPGHRMPQKPANKARKRRPETAAKTAV